MTAITLTREFRQILALFAATCALAMILFDSAAFPILLPTLQNQFGVTSLGIQWLMNGYFISAAAFVLICGRLVDTFGVRRSFSVGLGLFALSNLWMSYSMSYPGLIAGRVFQGIATAILGPAGMTILFDNFGAKERGRAIGLSAGFGGLFYAIGPFISGIMLEFYDYRSVFLLYLPLAIFGAGATMLSLPIRKKKHEPIDLFSLFFAFSLIASVTIGLMQYRVWGVHSYFVGGTTSVACLSLGGLFIRNFSGVDFIDLSLFRNRHFTAGLIVTFLTSMIMVSPIFWTIFLQKGLSISPINCASYIVVSTLPVVFVAPASGLYADKSGAQSPIILGYFSVLISVFSLILFSLYQSTGFMILAFASFGCGTALVLTPVGNITLGSVPQNKRGLASGIYNTMRFLGSALGVLIFGYISYNCRVETFDRLKPESLNHLTFQETFSLLRNNVDSFSVEVYNALKVIYTHAYFAGLSALNICNGFLAMIALLITLVYLKENKANN